MVLFGFMDFVEGGFLFFHFSFLLSLRMNPPLRM
jgi:hypothetical protein